MARQQLGVTAEAQVVTLLPASRKQEVKYLLPNIFQAAQQLQAQLPELQFLVPVSSPYFQPIMEQAIANYGLHGQVVKDAGAAAIAAADVAITKSGTANLEIALMNVPQVVTYRLNPLSAWIAQHILKIDIPFVSPVNLVEMQPVVPELLQWQATPAAIAQHTLELLTNQTSRQHMLAAYARMRTALGEPGACDRAAQIILDLLESKLAASPSESRSGGV
jgi:lipid-A-disaccharide synthase